MGHKKKSDEKAMVKMALITALLSLITAAFELVAKLLDR